MAGISDAPFIEKLAIPAVCLLISFLAYTSQFLFHTAENLDPGPPTRSQSIVFNVLLTCLWWTYYRACSVSPGRYPKISPGKPAYSDERKDVDGLPPGTRWCTKCDAPKPPRAHHCRHCRTCIPKMDHHCPWTANCVSLTTFPHFLRFLLYANLSLWTLSYLIYLRFAALWGARKWPSYLGPSLPALIHLTILGLVCFMTEVALGLMLATTVKGWALNMTTIEGWEIERHERTFERGWFDNDDRVVPEKVEFPYDVGFFANMAQAMGTRNFLLWFCPFAGAPAISPDGKGLGWEYEEDEVNDRKGMWPPPDPSRLDWRPVPVDAEGAMPIYSSPEEQREAFRLRQEADLRRWERQREGILAELEEVDSYDGHAPVGKGRPGWRDSDGNTLGDYGVDEGFEEIPVDDDDDVPLGELVRRRKGVRIEED
ncbi:hypothetical protein VUR80DRAFT_7268 [Thermomyces stellatus]